MLDIISHLRRLFLLEKSRKLMFIFSRVLFFKVYFVDVLKFADGS